MTTKICPVCGREQDQTTLDCASCGWDFSPLLGTPELVHALLQRRLEAARSAWRQRRYNPELIPALEPDPFETQEEFAKRIAERLWYVGEAGLNKAGYDIASGHFPLWLSAPKDWVNGWLKENARGYLRLPRDQAQALYQRSVAWPLYAQFAVRDGQVRFDGLVLVGPDQALPVFFQNGSAETYSEIEPVQPGRYRDHGDGTVTDVRTGLQWMRSALGQIWILVTSTGCAETFSWQQAFDTTWVFNHTGGFGGYRDWRLPTIKELRKLIASSWGQPQFWNETAKQWNGDYDRPTIDQAAFPNTPNGWFWSSSRDSRYPNDAWGVDFGEGFDSCANKSDRGYVRLVRGGG